MNYDNSLVVTVTVTCYSWAPSSGDHLFTCGAISGPPHLQFGKTYVCKEIPKVDQPRGFGTLREQCINRPAERPCLNLAGMNWRWLTFNNRVILRRRLSQQVQVVSAIKPGSDPPLRRSQGAMAPPNFLHILSFCTLRGSVPHGSHSKQTRS